MRKTIAALVLALLFTTSTSGRVGSGPIKPLPDSAFFPVPTVAPTPIPVILDVLPTPAPTKPPVPELVNHAVAKVTPQTVAKHVGHFILDPEVSWYGPGFYGKRTACGEAFTKTIMGVANRTLPCGTLVTFKYKTYVATVPVIDRGPYVAGRQWDLSGGLCTYLHHCFTGPIYYAVGNH